MPLREYRCEDCGGTIEQIELGLVATIIKWECTCNDGELHGELKEVISAPAIRFKGAGFHVNDYGKGPRYAVSSEAKKRHRQEIREAREHGEI